MDTEMRATTERTLNEELKARGYTTRPSRWASRKDVLDADGVVLLHAALAQDVWDWLRGMWTNN